MDAFIKKLCDKYKVLESDVQTLLGCMEEVHFKKRDLIVREGTKNSNLYFIKTGIWRAYYHKDGADATIWFASDGEAAFSVWGYADNAYSLINIEAMCDSVAYSISRATLNQLYHSSIGLANLGLRLMDHQLLLQENWLINSGSPRAKERYLTFIKETPDDDHAPSFPFLCLLVSGGNSQIIKVNAYNDMEVIGQTIDDAAGEAFDKCAKVMGLGDISHCPG